MRARWRSAVALVVLVATIWWLRVEVIDTVSVSSDSMSPTICVGDRLLVVRARAGEVAARGDLVTFRDPVEGAATLKRVVAVEGQTIKILDAVLHVDGRPVEETYVDLKSVDGTYLGAVTVPEGSIYVLGDQREFSIDSREYGPIRRSAVDGRVVGRLWSRCPS